MKMSLSLENKIKEYVKCTNQAIDDWLKEIVKPFIESEWLEDPVKHHEEIIQHLKELNIYTEIDFHYPDIVYRTYMGDVLLGEFVIKGEFVC